MQNINYKLFSATVIKQSNTHIIEETTAKYYEVVPVDATIENVLNLFYSNRKLIAILITKSGSLKEVPLGIVTASDVIIMNNILDSY